MRANGLGDFATCQAFVLGELSNRAHANKRHAIGFESELLEEFSFPGIIELRTVGKVRKQRLGKGMTIFDIGKLDGHLPQPIIANNKPLRNIARLVDEPQRRIQGTWGLVDAGR